MFDIDGIYNSQNDRIWVANRSAADTKDGIRQKRKFPQNVMVWLGVCSKGVSPLVIFKDGTMGPQSIHQRGASSCSQVW